MGEKNGTIRQPHILIIYWIPSMFWISYVPWNVKFGFMHRRFQKQHDSDRTITTKLYAKHNDFKFSITQFLLSSSNILFSAYGVNIYVSKLILCSRYIIRTFVIVQSFKKKQPLLSQDLHMPGRKWLFRDVLVVTIT